MGRRKTVYPDLPPNLTARVLKSGKTLYYYSDKGKKIPLGGNLEFAKETALRFKINGVNDANERLYDIFREEDIVSQSMPVEKICGVYFLVNGSRVVYIGQTIDIEDRVREHIQHGKIFERYFWVPCHPEDRRRLETAYILMINPPENVHAPATKHRIKINNSGAASLDLRV